MARKRKQSDKLPEASNSETPKEASASEASSSVENKAEGASKEESKPKAPRKKAVKKEEVEQKPEENQEPAPKPYSTPNPDDVIVDIRDAATSMLNGYKDNWLSALKVRAKQVGLGERATRREWRSLFISWGGPQILK